MLLAGSQCPCKMVNVLTHTAEVNLSSQQRSSITKLKKKYAAEDRRLFGTVERHVKNDVKHVLELNGKLMSEPEESKSCKECCALSEPC
ncbi:hypothetical protein U1Q18_039884 [Sarracenia purpurea var. burkii]